MTTDIVTALRIEAESYRRLYGFNMLVMQNAADEIERLRAIEDEHMARSQDDGKLEREIERLRAALAEPTDLPVANYTQRLLDATWRLRGSDERSNGTADLCVAIGSEADTEIERLRAAALTKLPTLDPKWPDNVRDAWHKCFEALRSMEPDTAGPVQTLEAQPVVTDAMVSAYLKANAEYWQRIDAEPTRLGVWRNGTPTEATRYALTVALAEPAPEAQPVAWIQRDHLAKASAAPFLCRVEPTQRVADFVPLYAHPPRLTPPRLTDEEIIAALHRLIMAGNYGHSMNRYRAIESAVRRQYGDDQ